MLNTRKCPTDQPTLWVPWACGDSCGVLDVVDWKTRMADLQGIMSYLDELTT
jgi:hypothetical protein